MKILLNLGLMLISFSEIRCHSIVEYEIAENYFKTFGYLDKSQNSSSDKISHKEFTRALKIFQNQRNLTITGKVDNSTINLMKRPRCGVIDKVHKNRQKRFTTLPTKWHKHHITWSFNHKNGRYFYDSSKIRRTISEALNLWHRHSTLIFEEIFDDIEEADIRISFEPRDHSEIDANIFSEMALAHAFAPGSKIGGDIHFREDVAWDFNVIFDEKPRDGRVSFFAVALHELGHSLGLGHSEYPDAVMYDIYSMNTATLTDDDIRGIQRIYGIPHHQPQLQSSGEEENFTPPNKCNMSYDAIATIRGELFIFHGKYMWRPNVDSEREFEIRQMWSELPENLKSVDAVYESSKGKILFFIGDEIFIFDATKLVDKWRLYHIGMGWNVKRIDAVFRLPSNKRIYILSGRNYWRFDEELIRVEPNYPKSILNFFRDSYDIDTAFAYEDQLYFFKDEFYFEFDEKHMRMKRMRPQISAGKFMKCPIANVITFSTRFNDGSQDFILMDEEDDQNFDTEEIGELNSGKSHRNQIYLTFAVILKFIIKINLFA